MSDVFLAGRGAASALGADLGEAVHTLRGGGVAPVNVALLPDLAVPYFALAPSAEDWPSRASRLVRAAAAESGLGASREGALFVASTSLYLGQLDGGGALGPDIAAFAERVGAWLGWRGPVFGVGGGCTSAITALLSAAALLRDGEVDQALVVGVELQNRLILAGFQGMQLLSATGAWPLGAARDGLVLGEAVAALRLSRQPARWRVCGGANIVDGTDPAGANAGTVAAMARQALARCGLAAEQIDLIKLQAAGSPHNDAVELAGLRQVFDPLPALLSCKAWIGHTLGAAGAAEIGLLTACIEGGLWPAVSHALDPALHATLSDQAPARLRHVMACILGFGGGHAAVVLEDRS